MKKIFLLADDDGDDMELFCEALDAVDPSVVCYCASNGLEVMNILSREEKPHLIFLDINMPAMNGWECLKAIKRTEAYKHIPVFMYSTSAHQREVNIALDLGAVCFFTKPHSFNELKSTLQVITEKIHANFLDEMSQINNLKCSDRNAM
jgi:CheY-like chemotaxis protein